jgi:alpha-methylacyl-CoA racemase
VTALPASPSGPLTGLNVIELGGMGPGPFAGMILADLGASVTRIDRPGTVDSLPDVVLRGRISIEVNLKSDEGRDLLLRLVEQSDILVEGFRPGVLERLGLSPDALWARNRSLVVGRVTGYGQVGPWASRAGHDITYAAISGTLHAIGPAEGPPVVPVNIAADGSGGWMLALGVVAAAWEAGRTGQGQVVEAAMVDSAALMMAKFHGEMAQGMWVDRRGSNRVDGGSHYYRVYETADHQHLAVGPIETAFYAKFLEVLGLEPASLPAQDDRERWPEMIELVAGIIGAHSLDHWLAAFDEHEACVAPVLSMSDARNHPQVAARDTFVTIDGITQPAAAPRFSRTPSRAGAIAPTGTHTDLVLSNLGLTQDQIARMRETGAIG